jgi:hypothetical protein
MRLSEFIFGVLAVLCGAAFGWALTMVCSHPEAAQIFYWISAIAFAMLGPVWALQASGYSMTTRGIMSASTVILSAAGLFFALSLKDSCAQTAAPNGSNCSINIGGDNKAPATNNCPTIYYGPKRQPSGLYQSDERVGLVNGAMLDNDNNEITLMNPRISSGVVDLTAPLEFQKFNLLCDQFVEIGKRVHAAQTTIMINGPLKCKITGMRDE